MININREKCIGCGLCSVDCLTNAIAMEGDTPVVDNDKCIDCAHCLAVCPMSAVSMPKYNKNEIIEYDKKKFTIDPDKLMNAIKFRRSIRKFKKQKIEKEKIDAIIEAGRYTPTGSNKQGNRYIILDEKLEELKLVAMQGLHDLAIENSETMKPVMLYRDKFESMQRVYTETGKDMLFYNAPTIIIVVNDRDAIINGALAASNMELMLNALGLGACYIGFFVRAVSIVPKLRDVLGLKKNEEIAAVLAVGYPDIEYKRTTNRKSANVTIM